MQLHWIAWRCSNSNSLSSNTTIESLNLDGNLLNGDHAALIVNSLKTNTKLSELYIGGNRITNIGIDWYVRVGLCNIQHLQSECTS